MSRYAFGSAILEALQTGLWPRLAISLGLLFYSRWGCVAKKRQKGDRSKKPLDRRINREIPAAANMRSLANAESNRPLSLFFAPYLAKERKSAYLQKRFKGGSL